MAGSARHQGVAARVDASRRVQHLEDVLDTLSDHRCCWYSMECRTRTTSAHALRSADAFGVHAVIAAKDRGRRITATVEKSLRRGGTVPYITVTNLARTLRELQERESG